MDIRNWLWNHRILYTHTEFAKKLNITRHYLSRVIHGKTRPSPKLAMQIQNLTHGEVKWYELIEKSLEVKASDDSTK